MTDAPTIDGLVASRICHDLISPVGALGNGLELVSLAGAVSADGEEMALVADCAKAARDALSFLRIAFGANAAGGEVGWLELSDAADPYMAPRRINLAWPEMSGSLPRAEAKARLLLLLCAQDGMPRGGFASATPAPRLSWRATGTALQPDKVEEKMRAIRGPEDCGAGDAHYIVLRELARALGREPFILHEGFEMELGLRG